MIDWTKSEKTMKFHNISLPENMKILEKTRISLQPPIFILERNFQEIYFQGIYFQGEMCEQFGSGYKDLTDIPAGWNTSFSQGPRPPNHMQAKAHGTHIPAVWSPNLPQGPSQPNHMQTYTWPFLFCAMTQINPQKSRMDQ